MTRLQWITYNNLKQMLVAGKLLLTSLEKAKKDSETPPQHEWVHGDVFRTSGNSEMIYIKPGGAPAQVFCLGVCSGHGDAEQWLDNGKFLFNIKEKL